MEKSIFILDAISTKFTQQAFTDSSSFHHAYSTPVRNYLLNDANGDGGG